MPMLRGHLASIDRPVCVGVELVRGCIYGVDILSLPRSIGQHRLCRIEKKLILWQDHHDSADTKLFGHIEADISYLMEIVASAVTATTLRVLKPFLVRSIPSLIGSSDICLIEPFNLSTFCPSENDIPALIFQ